MNDCIRVGKVSNIDYKNGYLQVTYPDRNDIVSTMLPHLNFEESYKMPKIGDMVLVALLPNAVSMGVVIGKYFTDENTPIEYGKNIYYKKLDDKGNHIKFDTDTETLFIKAKNIVIDIDQSIDISAKNISINAQTLSINTSDTQTFKGKKITLKGETDTLTIN